MRLIEVRGWRRLLEVNVDSIRLFEVGGCTRLSEVADEVTSGNLN